MIVVDIISSAIMHKMFIYKVFMFYLWNVGYLLWNRYPIPSIK